MSSSVRHQYRSVDPLKIRLALYARGISLREVERRLCVSHPTVLLWLRKNRLPDDVIPRIAEWCGVPVEVLSPAGGAL